MPIRISDLLPVEASIEVAPGKHLPIRPLALQEMVSLFLSGQEEFLAMYSAGLKIKDNSDLAPFLLATPGLVARVIGFASGTQGQEEDIMRLPATVQLEALREIWRLSVPDPKKARELLLEVTALLKKLLHAQNAEQKSN